jgi:hypothetical protein
VGCCGITSGRRRLRDKSSLSEDQDPVYNDLCFALAVNWGRLFRDGWARSITERHS